MFWNCSKISSHYLNETEDPNESVTILTLNSSSVNIFHRLVVQYEFLLHYDRNPALIICFTCLKCSDIPVLQSAADFFPCSCVLWLSFFSGLFRNSLGTLNVFPCFLWSRYTFDMGKAELNIELERKLMCF